MVVENNSEDPATFEYYERAQAADPRVRVVRFEGPFNYSAVCNLGVREARGELLLLLNNDTEVEDDTLHYLCETLAGNPAIGAVCPKIRFFAPPRHIQFAGYTPLTHVTLRNALIGFGMPDDGSFDTPRDTPYAHGAAMMVRREAVEKAGPMPEEYFLYYEELDWCVQIRRAGLKIWYEATSTVYHKESMSVGKQSPLQVYYHTRNRLLFAKRSIDKRDERIYAYIYQTLVAFPKRLSIYLVKGKFRLIGALGKGLINGLIAINKDMNYGKELSSH